METDSSRNDPHCSRDSRPLGGESIGCLLQDPGREDRSCQQGILERSFIRSGRSRAVRCASESRSRGKRSVFQQVESLVRLVLPEVSHRQERSKLLVARLRIALLPTVSGLGSDANEFGIVGSGKVHLPPVCP